MSGLGEVGFQRKVGRGGWGGGREGKGKRKKTRRNVPDAQPPNIAGGLLLKKLADLLNFGTARTRVKQQVTQFTGIGFHVNGSPGGWREALKDKDLMFGATFLLNSVHRADVPVKATGRYGKR